MAGEIDIQTVAKAYARWAPVYDLVFGAVFAAGRKASIAAAAHHGGRVLDVGVGTGISLLDYPSGVRVIVSAGRISDVVTAISGAAPALAGNRSSVLDGLC